MNLKKLFTIKLPLFGLAILLLALTTKGEPKAWTSSSQPLKEMARIRKLIKAPVFKNKDYDITDFGAKADGVTKNTEAFKKAIEACNTAGGGRVIVPAGEFLTGPIYLKSNVNLHLKKGLQYLFPEIQRIIQLF